MKEEIERIRSALNKTDVVNMFVSSEDDLVDACIDYLKSLGYNVQLPKDYSFNNLKKSEDLIELFYGLHRHYHPSKWIHKSRPSVERSIAKRFVEARMEASNLPKKIALKECAEIIKTIFEFENEFRFETPLTFSMLGQSKLSWITEKALFLLNNRENLRKKREHETLHKKLEELYDKEADEAVGYNNLPEILEKLKKETEQDGKKESRK